jgi:hypothetical protein
MGKAVWPRGNPLLEKHSMHFPEMLLFPSYYEKQGFTSFHSGSFSYEGVINCLLLHNLLQKIKKNIAK